MHQSIRDYISGYLELDRYSALQMHYAYPVHSLYLDSDDFALYQTTVNGDRNRYKLRVRYYDDQPSSPVFFEIKKRRDRVIAKHRAMVHRDALPHLLGGAAPSPEDLFEHDDVQWQDLLHFCDLATALSAVAKTHVGYTREAWVTPDNSVRMTFDHDVGSAPDGDATLSTSWDNLVPVFGRKMVFEVKFTDRFPTWIREMIRTFGLRQGSAAKYVDGLDRLHALQGGFGRNVVDRRATETPHAHLFAGALKS